MKKLLLAVPIALTLGFITLPAHAGTSQGIAVGEPYPGYDPYPGYPPYHQHDYDDEDEQDQISCWQGRQIVRHRGFRQVRPLRCEGSIYRYRAIRGERTWIVRVDSYSARIVSARPIRYY